MATNTWWPHVPRNETDININPLLCPGVRGNFSYQATVTYYDVREPLTAYGPVAYEMYTIFIPEGV